ncbi:amidohydrolase family protein [Microbulbifer variabilis]|uniref:amidohydrolase family protein n=1 Tax=Microbulbifer variabilis TaxID=266805 RepID=UPI001CFCCA99|nr:amidohydrolase family protein [Microbulbifer variabilis]
MIFDSHFHIISPGFPLYPNQGFTPNFFTTADYLSRLKGYDLIGGSVVSGSFQKQDHTYLKDALAKLGKNFVGVIQLLADTDDETILALNAIGVRAVRFNLKRGGSEEITKIKKFARRIYELANWHVELYVDSTQLEPLVPTLLALPCVSIDHFGLSKSGLRFLLSLAEKGVKVKATGFGRLDFDPATAITDFYKANPSCLMFGTDLPSTRAPRPFRDEDVTLIKETLGEPGASKVLRKNALALYLHRK